MLFLILMPLLGIGVAMVRRSLNADLADPPEDAPLRLLRWTTGLLSEHRNEWGQAMIGELGHIDGRARRWRFALGCAGAAVGLPSWGRTAAGLFAMISAAIGSLGLYAGVVVRYRLGIGDWLAAALALVFLATLIVVGAVLLCRSGVAVPGFLGGMFVALMWLAVSGFTFYGFIAPIPTTDLPLLLIVVPTVVGAAGTLWGGDAAFGRRTARLAAISSGLFLFLYGTLAVAVLGAGGPPDDSGWTVRYIVSDRLGNNILPNLVILPLVTATIGWAAAAVTAFIRQPPTLVNTDAATYTAFGRNQRTTMFGAAGSAVPPNQRRIIRLVLLCAVVAPVVLLATTTWLRS